MGSCIGQLHAVPAQYRVQKRMAGKSGVMTLLEIGFTQGRKFMYMIA